MKEFIGIQFNVATDHPYYCEDNGNGDNYESADDFLEIADELDPDYNLMIRYDYDEEENDDGSKHFVLKLSFLLQRKSYVWSVNICNIKEDDIPKINEYLKSKFDYLCKLWS